MLLMETPLYAMLALDLDGTLTNSQKQVTARTRDALHRAAAHGVTVVLASGRPVMGMRPVAEALDLCAMDGYIVACNGAQILRCRTDEAIFTSELPRKYLPRIFDIAREYDVAALSYDARGVITDRPDDRYVALEAFNNGLPIRGVDDLLASIDWPVPKIMVVGDPERLAPCAAYAQAQFEGALNPFLSERHFLEITALGITKASGLGVLLAHLHLTPERLMACGDGLNDLDMLGYAALGVAMDNAYPEVKAIADAHVASNDRDGVAEAVERFILCG